MMQSAHASPSIFDKTAAAVGSKRRRIALVGNAPTQRDIAETVDSADGVIRFNRPQGFGAGYDTGVGVLCLINSGSQAEEWLRERTLIQAEYFKASRSILFPNDPMILSHPPRGTERRPGTPVLISEQNSG